MLETLINGALVGWFVGTEADESASVAKSTSGEMVILDFDDQL